MNLVKVATSIGNCFEECYGIAKGIASVGYWAGDEEIGLDVYRTQRKLIAHLMVADNYLREPEVELYKIMHNVPEQSFDEIKETLLYIIETFPDFLAEVPAYLQAIMDFDIECSTNHTATVITNLEDIGIQVISCDDDISSKEINLLSSYVLFLKKVATIRGLKVTLVSDQLENFDQLLEQDEMLENATGIEPDVNALIAFLNGMVGLEKVKFDVTSLTNLIKVRELRRQQNMVIPPLSMHLVFTGNPGTGKTTVARLLAQIYKSLGVLSVGQLIEADRSAMVAGYLGQTALKTQDIVRQAIGGVLFIDEAYSLTNTQRGSDEYGQEAISTLIKLMEDNRDNLVVIVAGYPDKMEDFLKSNPGLRSRFNKFIHFDDYSAEELYTIFEQMCLKNGYTLTSNAIVAARLLLNAAHESKNTESGNGRLVRNFFETTISHQANRIAMKKTALSAVDLSTIYTQDLPGHLS